MVMFSYIPAFANDIVNRNIPSILTTLIERKDFETFKKMISDQKLTSETIRQLKDDNGKCLLHHAVQFKAEAHVDWCLDQGLYIGLTDHNYDTPVDVANRVGYKGIKFEERGM